MSDPRSCGQSSTGECTRGEWSGQSGLRKRQTDEVTRLPAATLPSMKRLARPARVSARSSTLTPAEPRREASLANAPQGHVAVAVAPRVDSAEFAVVSVGETITRIGR